MEQARKKKKKKGIIVAVVLVLLLGGGAVGITSCMKQMTETMQGMTGMSLEIVKAEKRDISNSISVAGTVESENIVKVTSKLNAKIKKLNVEVGSHVKEGDVLCEFDSSDFQQQYDTLSKNQNNSQNLSENQHKINERNLENAKRDKEISLQQAQRAIDDAIKARDDIYEKEGKIVDELNEQIVRQDNAKNKMNNAQDTQEYQDALETYQEAKAMVQSKEASLEAVRDQFSTYEKAVQTAQDAYDAAERSADAAIQNYQDVLDAEQYQNNNTTTQSDLDKLAESIADCVVKAPKSGIITSLNISEGSIPTTDALMTIEDSNALKITVQINEADILNVHEGQPAVVKTNATGDEELEAKVSRVVNIYNAGSQNPTSGAASGGYSAEITVKDDKNLLIGMSAKVRIILEEKKDVLSVPYEAIITDEENEDSKHVLSVVRNADGTATAKALKVETGMEGSYYTEITSGELTEGTEIVMNPGVFEDGDVLPLFDYNQAVQGAKADE